MAMNVVLFYILSNIYNNLQKSNLNKLNTLTYFSIKLCKSEFALGRQDSRRTDNLMFKVALFLSRIYMKSETHLNFH